MRICCLYSSIMLILIGLAGFETSYAQDNDALIRLLEYHFERYPEMQTDDVYKMLYQGSMGVAHFIGNPESARKYLEKEFEHTPADDSIPLMEPVSVSGELVRLNIAPYKAAGGDPETLFRAMMKTAGEFKPAKSELLELLERVTKLSEQREIPLDPEAFRNLLEEAEEYGYPAYHHSEKYRTEYNPAYRVILKKYGEGLISEKK